ncbi:MAG: TonB-dependent receptor [Planctomycetes bacterium]|nr:TonB-dependent receptor [Planctomycetota bacterium]
MTPAASARTLAVIALGVGCSFAASWAQDSGPQEQDPAKILEDMYFNEKALFQKIPDVVTPTRTSRSITRSSAAVSILTGEQIRRSGFPRLSDAMRMAPGAEVVRSFSTESNVSFRGFYGAAGTSSGVLLLIDGRPVYLDFSGENNWDNLPIALEDIERIEIIRGPGSFLYGPNAMHGVVNVITRRAHDVVRGTPEPYDVELSTTLGSTFTTISNLRAAYAAETWGARLTAGWDDIGEYSDRGARIKEMGFMNFVAHKNLGGDSGVELHGGAHDGKYESVRAGNLFVDLHREYGKANFWTGGLHVQFIYDQLHAEVENLNVQLVPPGSRVAAYTTNFDAHYSVDFPLGGEHTLTGGVGLIFNRGESDEIIDGSEHQWRPAAYVQDEWTLAENVFLTTGLRFDRHPEAKEQWSPQASLVYLPEEAHTLRASVKSGFRNPSFIESFVNLLSQPFPSADVPPPFSQVQVQFVPSDDLESEKMLSYQAGYSGRWLDRVKIGVDFYYNLIDDIIDAQTIGAVPISVSTILQTRRFENGTNLRAFGYEVSPEFLLTDTVSLWSNFAWQRVTDRKTGDRFLQAPKHKGNVGLRANFPDQRLLADIWVNHFGRTEFGGDFPGILETRQTLNFRLALRLTHVELWAAVTNLTHDVHLEVPGGEEFGREFFVGFQVH